MLQGYPVPRRLSQEGCPEALAVTYLFLLWLSPSPLQMNLSSPLGGCELLGDNSQLRFISSFLTWLSRLWIELSVNNCWIKNKKNEWFHSHFIHLREGTLTPSQIRDRPQTQVSGKLSWLLDKLNHFCYLPWGTWDKYNVFGELLSLTCLSLMSAETVFVLRKSHRKKYQHI